MGVKPILILGAMTSEVQVLLHAMKQEETFSMGSFLFWKGKMRDTPVVLGQTGIGTASAAAATALGCEVFRPQLVVNEGTAGAYTKDLHPYDIVVGTSYYNADAIHTSLKGKTLYLDLVALESSGKEAEYTDAEPFWRKTDDTWSAWLYAQNRSYNRGKVAKGRIASGDQWNAYPEKIEELARKTGALCEEMECAAVGEIARRYAIPYLPVRIISNNNRLQEAFDGETAIALQEWLAALFAKRDLPLVTKLS